MDENQVEPMGSDRRTFIKRGAVVGGALVWATPVVQTLAKPAFASESTPCEFRVIFVPPGAQSGETGKCMDFGKIVQSSECCQCRMQQGANCNEPCRGGTFVSEPAKPATCP